MTTKKLTPAQQEIFDRLNKGEKIIWDIRKNLLYWERCESTVYAKPLNAVIDILRGDLSFDESYYLYVTKK